jgi:hypothetical protein
MTGLVRRKLKSKIILTKAEVQVSLNMTVKSKDILASQLSSTSEVEEAPIYVRVCLQAVVYTSK